MAFQFDETHVYDGQLCVSKENKIPIALGIGPTKIKCSAYVQGPFLSGTPSLFPFPYATTMIGPADHAGLQPIVPGTLAIFPGGGGGNSSPYSLAVAGGSATMGNVDVQGHVTAALDVNAQGEVYGRCGRHVLSLKKDLPFDMPHPNKEGWRLRHVCIEGPEIAVYFRGRVKNREEILYPSYWKGLVDWTTVTVNLTPIGAHQNVIVKRFDEDKIYLQSKGGMPIDCFYHITARRLDDDLVVEYEGQSHEDYPGGNEGYSFNFEHNYVKGLIEKFVKETLDTES